MFYDIYIGSARVRAFGLHIPNDNGDLRDLKYQLGQLVFPDEIIAVWDRMFKCWFQWLPDTAELRFCGAERPLPHLVVDDGCQNHAYPLAEGG